MRWMTCKVGITLEESDMIIRTDQPMKTKYAHLSHQDRNLIQEELDQGSSMKTIAELLGKDPSTISKEVIKRKTKRESSTFNSVRNECTPKCTCRYFNLCPEKRCTIACRYCNQCNDNCPTYKKDVCKTLQRSPYLCNGCETKNTCRRERWHYNADKAYALSLSDSRAGISLSEWQLDELDALISPLLNR